MSSNHAAFAAKEWNGRCDGAGLLQRLDAVLNFGVLTVKDLQGSDVRVLLVGDEALETVPIKIGERELRSGVRTLAPADQPGTGWPGIEIDLAGQLGYPRSLAWLAVLACRGPPKRSLEARGSPF